MKPPNLDNVTKTTLKMAMRTWPFPRSSQLVFKQRYFPNLLKKIVPYVAPYPREKERLYTRGWLNSTVWYFLFTDEFSFPKSRTNTINRVLHIEWEAVVEKDESKVFKLYYRLSYLRVMKRVQLRLMKPYHRSFTKNG